MIMFLENEDSFSWNVIDRLPFERAEIAVVSSPLEAVERLSEARALVIGPGPRDPARAGLIGVVHQAAERNLPLLGICLGYQAIGAAFGARLVRAAPVHGMRWSVSFRPSRFFPAFHGSTEVMRYHSLALEDVRPPLAVIASTDEGIPMALEHERLLIAGLQFHPDSFATPRGEEMLRSFFQNAFGGRLA